MILRIYALSSPGIGRIGLTGITGERLQVLRVGGIAAVVGSAVRSVRPTPSALRAHARLLSSLAERAPALLPVRFGTQVRDPDELSEILRSRQHSLKGTLRRLRGRAQMIVRVLNAEEPPPQEGPILTGTQYLRARARAHSVPGFEPVRSSVRRWLRDERVEWHGRIVTVYHLIPRGSAAAYRRAVERSSKKAGVRLVVTGPWPPYAFAQGW